MIVIPPPAFSWILQQVAFSQFISCGLHHFTLHSLGYLFHLREQEENRQHFECFCSWSYWKTITVNCSYRDFTYAVHYVFRRLTFACCVKCMYQEKQGFALFCFVSSLINSPCGSKWCEFSERAVQFSTDNLLCERRWRGWIKDTFWNGAVYSYRQQKKVPEATYLEAKIAFNLIIC